MPCCSNRQFKVVSAGPSAGVEFVSRTGLYKTTTFSQMLADLSNKPFHIELQQACCQQLPECSLSRLWGSLKEDFERHGFFQLGALPGDNNRQRGVVRVNCIDCLDRTNVVQGLLGRKHLEYVLDRAGLLDATDLLALPNTFPQAGLPSLFLAEAKDSHLTWSGQDAECIMAPAVMPYLDVKPLLGTLRGLD